MFWDIGTLILHILKFRFCNNSLTFTNQGLIPVSIEKSTREIPFQPNRFATLWIAASATFKHLGQMIRVWKKKQGMTAADLRCNTAGGCALAETQTAAAPPGEKET